MKKQIALNLFSNYAARMVGMALGFVLVPFMIGKIGKEAFGVTVIAESLINFFEVLTVSLRMALSRHATFYLAKDKKTDYVEYLSTGRYMLFLSMAVVLVAGSALAFFFPNIFRVPSELHTQSKWLFFLIVLGVAISIPNVVYWSVVYSFKRFDLINLSSSIGLVFRAVAILAIFSFFPRHATLTTYGAIFLVMTWAQNALIHHWHKRLIPGLKLAWEHVRPARVREILSFAAHTSLSRLSSLLYTDTANILINLFWGPAQNAVFSVAVKLPTLMRRIFVEASWTLTPTFTELAAREEKEKIERLFFSYTKIMSILTIPLSLALAFFSWPLVRLWVGAEFKASADLLPVLALPMVALIPFAVGGCVTNAYARIKLPSRVLFATSVLNVVFGVLLGRVLGMGLLGIGLSASFFSFLNSSLYTSIYACHVLGVPVMRYWREAFLKPLLPSLAIMGGGALILGDAAAVSLPVLGISVAVFWAAASGLSALLFLDRGEKAEIGKALAAVRARLRPAGTGR